MAEAEWWGHWGQRKWWWDVVVDTCSDMVVDWWFNRTHGFIYDVYSHKCVVVQIDKNYSQK